MMVIAIAIIAYLLFNYFIAQTFHTAAIDKGYEESRFFWIPFIFGFLGQLAVVALPNKKQTELLERLCNQNSTARTAESNEQAQVNDNIIHTAEEQKQPTVHLIKCPKCDTKQAPDREVCYLCGYKFTTTH